MKVQKEEFFYHITVILQYCCGKTITWSGDMYEDDLGILSLVIKCFGFTNTSVRNFAVRISPLKTVPKCVQRLIVKVLWTNLIYMYLSIDVSTLCNSHVSKILQNYCDIVSNPSFCTFTCNDALYSVLLTMLFDCTIFNHMQLQLRGWKIAQYIILNRKITVTFSSTFWRWYLSSMNIIYANN